MAAARDLSVYAERRGKGEKRYGEIQEKFVRF